MKSVIIKVDGVDIPIWESDRAKSWRMVHNAGKCLALFEAEGITATKYMLFEGTQQQCLDEATRLSLTGVPDVVGDEIVGALEKAYSTARPAGMSAEAYVYEVLNPLLTKTPTKEEIETAVDVADTKLEEEGKLGAGSGAIVKP